MINLIAKKLGVIASATNELVADGTSYEEQLYVALVNAVSWYLDNACLTGTGAGQPMGVLNDPALITVPKETSQVAGTIVFDNLKKMFARLHPASMSNAVWVANSTVIPQILGLIQHVENVAGSENVGGSRVPVLREDGTGGFQILTRPVLFTEKLPQVGAAGDIALVDFSQYSLGLRQEVVIQKSAHAGFAEDETYYRAILRGDGMGRWSGPMTPKNGDTLSWCVTLAARV